MLESNLEEAKNNRAKIDDIELDVFEAFLRYIYTDLIDDMDQYAADLLVVADKVSLYYIFEYKKNT